MRPRTVIVAGAHHEARGFADANEIANATYVTRREQLYGLRVRDGDTVHLVGTWARVLPLDQLLTSNILKPKGENHVSEQ